MAVHGLLQLLRDRSRSFVTSSAHPPGKRRREPCDAIVIDLMPHREDYGFSVPFLFQESIQLLLWPFLSEKVWAEEDDAKFGASQAVINPSSQAVANHQLEVVIPNGQPEVIQRLSKVIRERNFVFAGVGQEDVPCELFASDWPARR